MKWMSGNWNETLENTINNMHVQVDETIDEENVVPRHSSNVPSPRRTTSRPSLALGGGQSPASCATNRCPCISRPCFSPWNAAGL